MSQEESQLELSTYEDPLKVLTTGYGYLITPGVFVYDYSAPLCMREWVPGYGRTQFRVHSELWFYR